MIRTITLALTLTFVAVGCTLGSTNSNKKEYQLGNLIIPKVNDVVVNEFRPKDARLIHFVVKEVPDIYLVLSHGEITDPGSSMEALETKIFEVTVNSLKKSLGFEKVLREPQIQKINSFEVVGMRWLTKDQRKVNFGLFIDKGVKEANSWTTFMWVQPDKLTTLKEKEALRKIEAVVKSIRKVSKSEQ